MSNCVERRLLTALVTATAACVMFEILDLERLTSLFFTLTFPLTLALWVVTVRETVEKEDIWLLVTLGAVALSVCLGGARAGFVTAAGLKKAVMLSMTLLLFRALQRMRADGTARNSIAAILDILSLVLLAAALVMGREPGYRTLRFSNPNLAGLFLCCLLMHQLRGLAGGKRRVFHGLLALGLGILLLQTQARNSIFVAAGYIFLWILSLFWKNRRFSAPLATAAAVFPALFVLLYLWLMQQDAVQYMLQFLTGPGKPLDSRLELWQIGLEAVPKAPLFGDLFRLPEKINQSQLHNSHLEIAGFFGLPVLLLVMRMLFSLLWQREPQEKEAFSARLGFAGCIALGMGEAAMFSGGLGIYVLMGLFLLRSDDREE